MLLSAPTPKNEIAVSPMLTKNGLGGNPGNASSHRNDRRGTMPTSKNATNVVAAARVADGPSREMPCSSTIIVSIHLSRSDVMMKTARSKSSPSNPFAAKICRTSSRSPSGTVSMCTSSCRRARVRCCWCGACCSGRAMRTCRGHE
jgi:hypothetical protein